MESWWPVGGWRSHLRVGGFDDFSISLFDARTGELVRTLPGHDSGVWGLGFSSSGKWLASVGKDWTIRLWRASDGTMLWAFDIVALHPTMKPPPPKPYPRFVPAEEHPTASRAAGVDANLSERAQVRFSADDKYAFVSCWAANYSPRVPDAFFPGRVIQIDVQTGRIIGLPELTRWYLGKAPRDKLGRWTAAYHTDVLASFLPDGKTAVTASQDDRIHFRDAATGKEQSSVEVVQGLLAPKAGRNTGMATGIWVSPDGRYVFLGRYESVELIDQKSGRPVKTLARQSNCKIPIYASMTFSPDGKTAVLVHDNKDYDREADILETATQNVRKRIVFCQGITLPAAFTADGKRLALGVGRAIHLWDVQSGNELEAGSGHAARIESIVFSPDGSLVATSSLDRSVHLWQARTGKKLFWWRVNRAEGTSRPIAFSPDNTLLAVCFEKHLDLIRCEDGTTVRRIEEPPEVGKDADHFWSVVTAISPDGKRLCVWTNYRCIYFQWDAETGELLRQRTLGEPGASAIRTGERRSRNFNGDAFSPSTRLLAASGMASRGVCAWDLNSGQRLVNRFSQDGYTSVRFSPDEHLLALGTQHGTIELIGVPELETLRTLQGPEGCAFPRAFLARGRILVSDHDDNNTRFWDLGTGKEVFRIDGRRLTACSPDGRLAASAEPSGEVLLWDMAALRTRPTR